MQNKNEARIELAFRFHRLKVILLTCYKANIDNIPFAELDENYANETIYQTIENLAPIEIFI